MLKELGLLSVALLVVGCGPTKQAGTPESPSSGDAKLKVVYIPKSAGNPYFNQVQAGFEAAAKELGFDFQLQAPATAEATSQLSIIKDQVQRGVDVIAITPNSPDALNEELDLAREKGIIVMAVDADLTGNETHRDAAVLPTDFTQVGPSQLELLGKLMNYEGEFAILSATTDAPNQNAWIAGMKEAMKDAKYAKMKLVEVVYGDDESQKSSTEAESLLTKHPNLKGIISPTSVGLAAAAQVLENSGNYPSGPKAKNGGLHLTGLSTPNQLRKAVEKGVVTAFQLWSPADMGFTAAYLSVELKGKKLEAKEGTEAQVPSKNKVKFGPNGVVFTGPLVTFDKANIGQYQF